MRIRDWSSDVCSSYLVDIIEPHPLEALVAARDQIFAAAADIAVRAGPHIPPRLGRDHQFVAVRGEIGREDAAEILLRRAVWRRSEEHTYEIQSLMRSSYAVFCLKKKNTSKS